MDSGRTLRKIREAVDQFYIDYRRSPQVIVAWDGYYMDERIHEYAGIPIVWSPCAHHINAY